MKEFTHINSSGNHSIIDLAFISSPELLISCTTVPPLGTSDHHGFNLCFRGSLPKRPSRCLRKSIWCYQDTDFNKACELLNESNWEALVNDCAGVDVSWDTGIVTSH